MEISPARIRRLGAGVRRLWVLPFLNLPLRSLRLSTFIFVDSILSHTPGGNRTPNLPLWRRLLCQLSYWRKACRLAASILPLLPLNLMQRMFPQSPAILLQLDLGGTRLPPSIPSGSSDRPSPCIAATPFRGFLCHKSTHILRNQQPAELNPLATDLAPTPGPHWPAFYARIFVTTPEPTVLPPSRTAKRSFSSIAIGAINSTSIVTLSPGITISAPPFNFARPGHVRRPEIKLRTISVEERRMPTSLFLRQHVNFRLELRVRRDALRRRQNLAALKIVLFNASQKHAHVLARLTFIQRLIKRLNAGHDRIPIRLQPDDLNRSHRSSPARARYAQYRPCRGP